MKWITDLATNPFWSTLLYFLPLFMCAYGYTIKTWQNYQKDVRTREAEQQLENGTTWPYYSPTDTIGSLIGRGLVTIIPVANLFAAAFDVGPKIFSGFFKWISKVFDQPLVPKRK